MDDLLLVRAELEKAEYKEIPALAAESGVPVGTLAKIKCGATKNPRYDTVKQFADFIRGKRKRKVAA